MALGDGYQPYPVAPRRAGIARIRRPPARPGINIKGQTFLDLIKADPGYIRRVGENTEASKAGAAARAAAIRSALVRFGNVPGLDLGGNGQYADWLNADVDPATRALADQNTASGLSLSAQMQAQHKDNTTALQDMLAAKGILSSGQTGFETGRENLRHAGAQQDAVQQLLQFILGQYGGFAEAEAGRASDLGDYGETVTGRLQEEGVTPAAGGEAGWDETTGSYVLNGQHYDEAGNPIVAPPRIVKPPASRLPPARVAQNAWRRKIVRRAPGRGQVRK